MVNFICICVVAINFFGMGMLAMSAHAWEGTGNATATNRTFVVLQIILLCGESRSMRRRRYNPVVSRPCDRCQQVSQLPTTFCSSDFA